MYLGLDLGTSGLRAVLVDGEGRVLAASDQAYPVSHPHSGWSEQDPAEWIAATERALDALSQSHPKELAALRAIGLSGQMHGATLLDGANEVLRPAILWNDTRAATEAAAMDGDPAFRAISGNIVFPGFTAPKLAWVQVHEPEIFGRVAMVLLPKDYLRLWLTGDHASDMSDSAGTSWMDTGKRAWSTDLLGKAGMRLDQMPRLVEGSEVSGTLRREVAKRWGLSESVKVVGGGGDNSASACGVGCFDEGDGFVSLGTSGVLLAAKAGFAPSPETAVHTFCHSVPDTWYQMGVILAATDCLNWLAAQTGTKPAELSALVGDRIDGPGSIRFLPYLSGERTPHNDARIRGAFVGLSIGDGHKELTQAVMEGVAFALKDNHEALKATGTTLNRLLAIGGGSKSDYWVELIATLLGAPIDLPEKGEFGAALGAARLAIVGDTGAAPSEVMTRPAVARTIQPRADLAHAYDESYAQYRALYPALKEIT
ncbi:xylulokinase [Sinisalibacter lacisalsi]|uniref:Xylulose kinase n=1 Tax=Sinisalibacter lacisalsi TaxID=1526570 RepID=A0ABQ1QE47_9RHOB|nr:xylulokinase [Sinisalibacter lacisalsi]GGD22290.1 xylulokinase [Sinisalibacter lacisalsi]